MKIGRNDPCPCGSGKKYKKCCLEKDEALARSSPPVAEVVGSVEEPVETRVRAAERRRADAEAATIIDIESIKEGGDADDLEEIADVLEVDEEEEDDLEDEEEEPQYPRPDTDLPELSAEEEKIVDDWWAVTNEFFEKRDVDQLLSRVERALVEIPTLFVYLGLDEELLFELGADLERLGRTTEYVNLLKRLRREQPRMYSFSFGAFDSDVIAELVVEGRPDEIAAYLDFFKQYPDSNPEYCGIILNLLAWRNHAAALYELCDAVTGPMLKSSRVLGGDFALAWLIRREESRYFEAEDPSAEALEKAVESVRKLSERFEFRMENYGDWMARGLKAYMERPKIEKPRRPTEQDVRAILANFMSHLRHVKNIPWAQTYFLADLVAQYLDWCDTKKISWLRFGTEDVEAFIMARAQRLFGVNGVLMFGIIQALVWFAEYIRSTTALAGWDTQKLMASYRNLFERARKALGPTDVACRLFPTFEDLVDDGKAGLPALH